MSDPKKQDKDEDYNKKVDKAIDAKIRSLEDIKDTRPEGDPFKEQLEREIDNLKNAK